MSTIKVTKNVPMAVYVNEYSFTPEPVAINHADFLQIKQTYFDSGAGSNKINAIKKLRELYKIGLADAKYLVELMVETEGWLDELDRKASLGAPGTSLGDILADALKKQADANSR